jgi:hypothetical protein
LLDIYPDALYSDTRVCSHNMDILCKYGKPFYIGIISRQVDVILTQPAKAKIQSWGLRHKEAAWRR